jgi:hypothetical protein
MLQYLKLAILMIAAAAVGGCGDDDGEGFDPTDEVQIRAVHAAPGAPALEVLITDTRIADNLAYGQSTRYQSISGGDQVLRVNSDFGDQNEELFAVEAPLTAGAAYTVVVSVISGGGVGDLSSFIITDDNAAPPTGQAKLRAVHASPSATDVDVYVTAAGADLATTAPTFTAVVFTTASSYATLPVGPYQVRITPAGSKDVLIDAGVVQLVEGDIRTAVAIESPAGGPPYSGVILDDRVQ